MNTTHTYWNAGDGEPFKGVEINGYRNCMLIEVSQDTDDGTFPRVSDYTRYANGLENEGTSYFLNRSARRNKLKFKYDSFTVTRDSKFNNEAVIEFDEPITVVLANVGEETIVKKIKKMKGEFTHDWFWTRNGRQDKIANGFEIWFSIKEYLA
jgi:hypothetical protein